jgi:hypothetical protein
MDFLNVPRGTRTFLARPMREASISQQIIDPVLTLQVKKQEAATAQNSF